MKKHCFLYLLSATLLLGCSSNSERYDTLSESLDSVEEECINVSSSGDVPPPPPGTIEEESLVSQDKVQKKIVKKGELTLQCENLQQAKQSVDSLTKKLNGYYTKENYVKASEYSYYRENRYEIIIRIPNSNFNNFMSGVEGNGNKILYKNVSTIDKTSEYYDAESRKKTKEAVAERYRELLKKCNTIKDIIEVQSKLDRIQEDAEAQAAKMLLIDDQVNFSTIELTLKDKEIVESNRDKEDSILGSLKDGWDLAKNTVYLIVKLWPFLIIGGALFYFIRKRRMSKKS